MFLLLISAVLAVFALQLTMYLVTGFRRSPMMMVPLLSSATGSIGAALWGVSVLRRSQRMSRLGFAILCGGIGIWVLMANFESYWVPFVFGK